MIQIYGFQAMKRSKLQDMRHGAFHRHWNQNKTTPRNLVAFLMKWRP